jgi:hypothetical protein
VFRQPVGDEANIAACLVEIAKLADKIRGAKSLQLWGVHAKIVRLLRFAEHEDLPVRTAAYEELAVLAYQDQMTRNRSFFLSLVPIDPGVDIFIHSIEEEKDPTVRNLATQVLVACLQMNVGNKYGLPITFYQGIQAYDESRGHVLVPEFVQYINESDERSHQTDAMLLLNQICRVDTNHLVEVAQVALPLLKERIQQGYAIEQYAAVQLATMIAGRFDLAQKLIRCALPVPITIEMRCSDGY